MTLWPWGLFYLLLVIEVIAVIAFLYHEEIKDEPWDRLGRWKGDRRE